MGLQLDYILIRTNAVASVKDLPILGKSYSTQGMLTDPVGDQGRRLTMNQSNARQSVSDALSDSKGSLKFVAQVLGNPVTWKQTVGIQKIMKPSRDENGIALQQLGTRKGSHEWICSMVDGRYQHVIQDTLHVLFDAGCVGEIGFMQQSDDSIFRDESDVADESELAERLASFMVHLIEQLTLTEALYKYGLPAGFARIATPWDAGRTAAGLERLRKQFEFMEAVDREIHRHNKPAKKAS